MKFFQSSGRNLLAAEAAAGVRHHVALSVVGTDRLLESGYFRAKMAQEELIKASGIPYSILRSTQFFEFVGGIVKSGIESDLVRLSPTLVHPHASADVAPPLPEFTLASPLTAPLHVPVPSAAPRYPPTPPP